MEEPEPVVVYAGWAAFGIPDFSPACLKLKTYLRMAKIAYRTKRGDPRRGPTKKVPYITHRGQTVGDSGLIIEYLKREYGDSLDQRLTCEQHAMGHLVQRTLEESLYFPMLWMRWGDPTTASQIEAQFRPLLPKVIGPLAFLLMRKNTLRNAWGQGMARHTPEQIVKHGSSDIDAVAKVLGDQPYLFGDAPSSYDASLYGTIANVLALPAEGPLAAQVRRHPGLVAFAQRVSEAYWSTSDSVE